MNPKNSIHYFIALLIVLFNFQSSSAQQSDSIRITIPDFVNKSVLDAVQAEELEKLVPQRMMEVLKRDYFLIAAKEATRVKIAADRTNGQVLTPQNKSKVDYYITGNLYENKLSVRVHQLPNEESFLIEEEWILTNKNFPVTVIVDVANQIWKKIKRVDEQLDATAQLKIKSKLVTVPIYIDAEQLRPGQSSYQIPVITPERILIRVGGEINKIRLQDHYYNRLLLKRRNDDSYVIRPQRWQLQTGVSSLFGRTGYALAAHASTTFLLTKGWSIGTQFQAFQAPFKFDYPTLDGTTPLLLSERVTDWNAAFLMTYQRYIADAKVTVEIDGFAIAYPENGFGLRLGITPERLSMLNVHIGYQQFNFSADIPNFQPYGNATYSASVQQFSGLSLGVGLNHYW